jgi:hypothetical protein
MPVEPNPTRQQFPLVVWIIMIVVAGLVLWGIWTFLHGERHPAQRHPPQTSSRFQGQHVIPVGGEVLDGVYRPSGNVRDWSPQPPTTLSRCTLSVATQATKVSSTLRTSSKL